MLKGTDDLYFIWYCDWCDSKHSIPWVLQHESRHFCPACSRQTVLATNRPRSDL
jgi:uncharacterized paraquat-inducible protein A